MAISIDATAGGEDANSYLTLSDAQDIIDGLVEDDDVVAWDSATDDQKIAPCLPLRSALIASGF